MTINKHFLYAATALLSVAFISCSNDDDNDSSNSSSSSSVAFDSHAIDLGLPSGNLWADQNVGANAPEEFGGYYAWGAIVTYTSYSTDTYVVDTDAAGADWGGNPLFDIATLTYGGNWRTPSYSDYNELILNTTKEWTTVNDVKGLKFIGPNGNSIFFPAAGYAIEEGFQRVGFLGAYVSSTADPGYVGLGVRTEINAGGAGQAGYYSYQGGSVRGVKRK
ncbi:MAG: hypothetical protein IJ693_10685 [Bacteroidaceae bacterium]|nr:hypothetical protein [Bacteroidaceae bacterium]